ncbi:hypothetical protein AWH56_008990 [Anaerobacillus isosaccharinicus]|uniref:Uncharacterized protein n=1 Tax=Anaerobacillus isosaccharinicus TaxID=1532552 RepID=A0A7S7LB13_9BACI|nr:hypothetical protein [Anaerobacillus isosaccharinicus]MBA5588887.1 hypothetical protein [Anaerobacillus isosaccharinicus]QOY37697.1 hypothetical protein AWH56_008990 [Anaerobacillus isosaccharinicus]
MLKDKKASKLYKKLVTSNEPFQQYEIVESMNSDLAKEVLLKLVINQKMKVSGE